MRFPREVRLDDQGAFHRLEGTADVDRAVRALHVCFGTLEEIGQFDKGMAGERATQTLKDLGVWSERVQRIESSERANDVETVAVAIFTAASPKLDGQPMKWRFLDDSIKERWRQYAIEIIDTEAILG